jgi:predicted transcriptional regulator of viral defense system
VRLLVALEGAGVDPFTTAQAVNEGAALDLTPRHTITLLHRLAASGWITRIKKGVYVINDPVTRLPKAHPFAIGTALVTPSAVSHWSALQYWGLTEQIPGVITVASPRRTFPPSDEAQSVNDHSAWSVAGISYEVIAITEARFFGVAQVWINERTQVPIFDRERALLDAFHHFQVFGSLSVGLEILEARFDDIDIPRLVQHAQQLGVAAVVKRVGWALDRLGAAPDVLAPLRDYPVKGESPLDPGQPARGRHNSTWRVIENLHDGQ